jgi:hypothetical protein
MIDTHSRTSSTNEFDPLMRRMSFGAIYGGLGAISLIEE